jgi:hypothetical protein
MKILIRSFKAAKIVLTILLIHFGLMEEVRNNLNSIEYDFKAIF